MIDIQQIIVKQGSSVGNTLFISVDGHGGSGKSTFAKLLGDKLDAQVIQTDDFASWDNPYDWWPAVIEKVFEPIAVGAQALSYERSKWWENHHPEPVTDQPVTQIMILEGVSSSRREFRQYIGVSIFVDTPEELCLERGVARDTGTDTSEEELRKIWKQWIIKENEYFAKDDPRGYADVIIGGTKSFDEQISV